MQARHQVRAGGGSDTADCRPGNRTHAHWWQRKYLTTQLDNVLVLDTVSVSHQHRCLLKQEVKVI